jgi:hypothetical protein
VPNFFGNLPYQGCRGASTFLRVSLIFTLVSVGAALAFIGYGPSDLTYDSLGAAAPGQVV